ncbi:hypothetical protein, partial [Gemmiger formicilis]|uniref:hypothetical protein n=1 Tax=Gemmiger formicilis TaxID=745368 RepID=UPI003CF8C90D
MVQYRLYRFDSNPFRVTNCDYHKNEAVAQGKNPSAAASLRVNASRSAKMLAIDPLISKKQITQTGPSE